MIDRSRRMLQTPQYEPNDSARVGEGRSVLRGRVLSQSLLVARERRRRELGSNLVIVTTTFTSGEGHVVEDGLSQRVRKILAGVPASVSFRDLILALSFSRSKRQHWTVGNRPIRYYDLRSLRRNSAEAQIQDRSRQKTGLNTVPGFSRVYTSFPRTREPSERGYPGRRGAHLRRSFTRMGWELDVTWRKLVTGISPTSSSGIVPAKLMNLDYLRPSVERYGAALNYRDFRWIWLGSLGGPVRHFGPS